MSKPTPWTIGVLAPFTGGVYYGAVLQGIQRVAQSRGATVVVIESLGAELCWPGTDQCLGLDVIDGWLAINEFDDQRYMQAIHRTNAPFVTVNAHTEQIPSCSVLPDNFGGTKAAVLHLIEHGHRRIAFAASMHQHDLRERHEGYLASMRDAGLEEHCQTLRTSYNLESDGRTLGRQLTAKGFEFTALVAGTDKLALGLAAELMARGRDIPRELAIVGFDDIDEAQYANPPLTTVRQSFALVASTATTALLDHLASGAALPRTIRVPTQLIQRRSCGCARLESLRPPALRGSPESCTHALIDELESVVRRKAEPNEVVDWPGAARIAQYLAAAVRSDAALDDLNGAWGGFLRYARDAERVDKVLFILESTARAWCDDLELRPEVVGALRDLRVALLRDWQRGEQRRIRQYETLGEASAKIQRTLAGSRYETVTDLSWLELTHAKYGCVGLWEVQRDGRRLLKIANEYCVNQDAHFLSGEQIEPRKLPPARLGRIIRELDPSSILTLAPLRSSGPNRGWLIVAAPIVGELLDHIGNIGDWATQLGVSLDRVLSEHQLQHNALRDALTRLPNRARLVELLDESIRDASAGQLAILLLDLDDFKKVNDSLGHQAGDDLLVQLAERLVGILQKDHLLARLGGDEFVVVLPNVQSESAAVSFARLVQETVRAPFQLKTDKVFSSCSIGITFNDVPDTTPAALLRDADTAMYRAKLQGRARHEMFQRSMHLRAVERLKLDTRLRQALERSEFVLHYQPIVYAGRGTLAGAEALLRWNHPERGLLAPGRFLAVADELGLTVPISHWVLTAACEQAKAWRRAGRSRYVSVNVPAEHLQQDGFVGFVRELLKRFDLDPRALCLELVESTLVENRERTTRTLAELIEVGVRIAIDDFGTGYSSLSYLRDFPLSLLKIDRSFVREIPSNPRDSAIAQAIITMGQGLGLGVVAEGVETEAQFDFLRSAGCDLIQGYFVGRPMSVEDWDTMAHPRPTSTMMERVVPPR